MKMNVLSLFTCPTLAHMSLFMYNRDGENKSLLQDLFFQCSEDSSKQSRENWSGRMFDDIFVCIILRHCYNS